LTRFAPSGGIGYLRDGWPVASFTIFGRLVRKFFLLLLLQLLWLVLLVWRNFQRHSLIEEFVKGVISVAGGHHRSNIVLARVGAACPGNNVEDFFMLL
jgi:hypothetical protein